jgi:hypothetical protein
MPGNDSTGQPRCAGDALDQIRQGVSAFAEAYRRKVGTWQRDLEGMARTGQRAVVWGAGSKGVTFLNTLGPYSSIEYVVDINPHKEGMCVAGTGQRIVSPEFLPTYRPDVVIVMNPLYTDEIDASLERRGLSAELVCA